MLQPPPRDFAAVYPRFCVVAIPVKDEAERLPACLEALAAQREARGRRLAPDAFGVLLFANNCTDGSAALARRLTAGWPFEVRIVERRLPAGQAHAGGARRAAMDLASVWAGPQGAILTTDADSRVPPDWVAANRAAFETDVDAVLGRVALDEEGDALPDALHRRGALESAYEQALVEIAAWLDPRAHDPWPHHATISGASLGVTVEAYRRVGGLPGVPVGEDKALVAALEAQDARLRYAPGIVVTTSGRVKGRAPGGVADTLRLRSDDPEAPCDEALEAVRTAIRRAGWRGRLRRAHESGDLSAARDWARALGLAPDEASGIAGAARFGAAWRAIEAASPSLARRPIRPAELPGQIAAARHALRWIRRVALAARQQVEPEFGKPRLAEDRQSVAEPGDETRRGLVAG
jgi:GT2 family glycosyltransferase